jgi:hypothetical protein
MGQDRIPEENIQSCFTYEETEAREVRSLYYDVAQLSWLLESERKKISRPGAKRATSATAFFQSFLQPHTMSLKSNKKGKKAKLSYNYPIRVATSYTELFKYRF